MTTLVNFYPLALTLISHSALNLKITILGDKLAVFLFHIMILNGMVDNSSTTLYLLEPPIGGSQHKPIVTY